MKMQLTLLLICHLSWSFAYCFPPSRLDKGEAVVVGIWEWGKEKYEFAANGRFQGTILGKDGEPALRWTGQYTVTNNSIVIREDLGLIKIERAAKIYRSESGESVLRFQDSALQDFKRR